MKQSKPSGETPEIKEAWSEVVEAFGDAVSTQMSLLLHTRRRTLATLIVALFSVLLGIILGALAIRDALRHAFPNHAEIAVAVIACLFVALSAGVLTQLRGADLTRRP